MPLEDHTPANATPPQNTDKRSLIQWIAAGLRAALCMRVDVGRAAPAPAQLLALIVVAAAAQIGLARLEVPGDATFQLLGWLYPLCVTGFLLFWLWAALTSKHARTDHPAPVPTWFALWTVAGIPMGALTNLWSALAARDGLPAWWVTGGGWAWLLYGLMWVWLVVVAWRVTSSLSPSGLTRTRIVIGVLLMEAFTAWQIDSTAWQADVSAQQQEQNGTASLSLSQEVFEDQQALLSDTLAALSPRQNDRINVFGVVYAPYSQSVFVRESALVANVLQQRFQAEGHVVQLVNHPSVTDNIPWATNTNLRASLKAIANKMDLDQDVLVVYLSSHGGSDFKLASAHWPLSVEELTPQMLRTMLDEVGVRNRVIAVSACFSGGWITPLANDTTLVMTAADADHTSYGCGSKSELTFFGRALFDEQLRNTYSFEQAFAAAVPIIQQREIDGKKEDGFSNPQIAVGRDIRRVLSELEKGLQGIAR